MFRVSSIETSGRLFTTQRVRWAEQWRSGARSGAGARSPPLLSSALLPLAHKQHSTCILYILLRNTASPQTRAPLPSTPSPSTPHPTSPDYLVLRTRSAPPTRPAPLTSRLLLSPRHTARGN
eukprot:1597928-Rhodomonas_salina.2